MCFCWYEYLVNKAAYVNTAISDFLRETGWRSSKSDKLRTECRGAKYYRWGWWDIKSHRQAGWLVLRTLQVQINVLHWEIPRKRNLCRLLFNQRIFPRSSKIGSWMVTQRYPKTRIYIIQAGHPSVLPISKQVKRRYLMRRDLTPGAQSLKRPLKLLKVCFR